MSHILIADDDKLLTGLYSQAFERAGYSTTIAHDGHEAVYQLIHHKPDLILLDLILPGIDGIHVLKFIRSRPDLERLPVFIVSNSNYFSGIAQTACNEGATCFIQKGDLSPAGLVEEVRNTIPPSGYVEPPSDQSLPIDYHTVQEEPKGSPMKQGPKSALIADDDRTIHGVLAYFLGQAGFQVESAFNGFQALEMARQHPPSVLILDVTMPIKDGFKTLAEWEQDPELHDVPVIMLTASKDEEKQHKAISQGASNYLTKPFSPDAVVSLAEKLVAR